MTAALAGLAKMFHELDLALVWFESGLIMLLCSVLVLLGLVTTPMIAFGMAGQDTVLGMISLVFVWLMLLGGMHAAGQSAHPAFGSARLDKLANSSVMIRIGVPLICGLVCVGLMWAGWKLLVLDVSLGSSSRAGVPAWPAVAALPVGFALMAVRFLSRAMSASIATIQASSED